MKWYFLIAAFLIVSCDPGTVDPPSNQELLRSIQMNDPVQGSVWSMKFIYDNQNRIIKIEESEAKPGTPTAVASWTFSYEGNNKLPKEGVNTVNLTGTTFIYKHYYRNTRQNDFDPLNDSMVTTMGPGLIKREVTRFTGFPQLTSHDYEGYSNHYLDDNSGTVKTDSSFFTITVGDPLGSTGIDQDFFDASQSSSTPDRRRFSMHFKIQNNNYPMMYNSLHTLNIAPVFYLQLLSSLGKDFIVNTSNQYPVRQNEYIYWDHGGILYEENSDFQHRYGKDSSIVPSRPLFDTIQGNYNYNGTQGSYGPVFVKYTYE